MNDVHLSGAAVIVITALLASLSGVVTFLFKLLLKSKDDQYADIRIERDNYRILATEAINLLEHSINVEKKVQEVDKVSNLRERMSPNPEGKK